MKRFIPYIALLALVVMVGCSADSPRANQVPTVVPEAWSISSIQLTNTSPSVGSAIGVEAVVTKDGSPAPDNTTVSFSVALVSSSAADPVYGFDNTAGKYAATALTDNGRASVDFVSQDEAVFEIEAQVKGASRRVSVRFEEGLTIFGVSPNTGRSSGGEIVNILGQDFGSSAANVSVTFTDTGGGARTGTVVSVAPDGTQIQVETPRFSTIPLTADEPQDVTVTTLTGVTTLDDAFIVLADEPTPDISSISPTAGPLDGGTLVTIFGHGFQAPVQVRFGNLEALDVNVFNDTTVADNDRITCVTPDYSQQGEVPPVAVDVTVMNMISGFDSIFSSFTYGDALYITGNSPTEGGLGDLVIIYGSGFKDPLQVFLGNALMEVVSVSGTELVIRIPDDLATECSGMSGNFKVVLLESGLEATGGQFNIVGNSPTVLSVSPIILAEADLGTAAADITITGLDFANEVLVSVGTYIMPSSQVTVNGPTSIDVQNLPDAGTLGITFATSPCTTGGGQPGVQSTSTPLTVSVTNFPGACEDTLTGAIVVEPTASVCTALSMNVAPLALNFGTAAGGQVFTITNTGPGAFSWTATESDPDNVFSVAPTGGTLGIGEFVNVTVTFAYAVAPGVHTGSVQITTNPAGVAGSPATVDLTAETPVGISVTPSPLAFPGTTDFPGPSTPETVTIAETSGAAPLTVNSLVLTGRFFFDAGCSSQNAAGFNVPAGGNTTVDVYFCPNLDNGLVYNGTLTVTSNAPTSPDVVNLSGTETP